MLITLVTNILLRLNQILQKLLLLLFLLTGLINNSNAINISTLSDTTYENSFFNSKIEKDAEDSIKLDIINKKAYLYGNAKIKYQNTTITAAYIEIDWITNTIFATTKIDSLGNKTGHPVFTEKNESFKAHEITYNFKSRKCRVNQITTKEGDGYILGKVVKKMENDVFYLKKGDYTTCDSEKPHYAIRANKIKVIPGEKIITGPAYLTFFNIPMPLILPFGFFPNNDKKISGLIIPSYGESANMGFFLKDGGYYFTLTEKVDLSLKSNIHTKGSWSVKSQLRYKNRYRYNGNLNLNFGKNFNSEKGFPNYSEKKDFNIQWRHQQDPKAKPSLTFSANVEAGSSSYHRNNSYNANDFLKNTMSSSINLTKNWEGALISNLTFNLRHSQNITTKNINLTIPDVSLNSKRFYPFKSIGSSAKIQWYDKIMIKYGMNTKNTISTADSLLFTKKSFSNFRNGMRHNIPISTSIKVLKHFTLNPSFNLTERWYLSQTEKRWNTNNNTIITDTIHKFTRAHNYNISTGLNTKIYGMIKFNKSKIAAIRHVITPNISFNYTPDFSDKKYGYYKNVQKNIEGETEQYSIMNNGVYGSPSKGKKGNITLAISNILGMKIKSKRDTAESFKKIKLLENLSVRSSYNIFSDSLNLSNINLNARTRLLDIFDVSFSSTYNPYITNQGQDGIINTLELNTNKRLARLTNLNATIGFTLSDKTFSAKNDKEEEEEEEEDNKIENKEDQERDFYTIPWSLTANYSLFYNKGYKSSAYSDTTQSLNFSGNLKLTKKWKIGFRSGYDFDAKKLTYSSIDIYRDLHCWELLFNYIPIGYHQSYSLTIRVKAAALRDLKFERKKDWFTPDYN